MATRTRRSAAKSEPFDGFDEDFGDTEYREPGEAYDGPPPTKGMYRVKLVSVESHESAAGNTGRKWVFDILPGETNKHGEDVGGWRGYKYTNNEGAKYIEQMILVALGLIKPGDKCKLSYAQVVAKAKPCLVRVVMEKYVPEDGEDAEWVPKLAAGFLPDRTTGKAKAAEIDEEDDDEDEPPVRARRSRAKAAPEPEPEEEDDEEEEPEYDPDELAEELEALTLAALKKRARDEFGVTVARGDDADKIIDKILDTLPEEEDAEEADEDDEEEEEEEAPKRPARTSSRGKAAPPARKSRRTGFSDEPPF